MFEGITPKAVGRFISKIDPNGPTNPSVGTPCHVWTRSVDMHGYGHLGVTLYRGQTRLYRMARAHRLAWELANGPLQPGQQVLHRCDNRRCVNPDHLFLGTNADNVVDRTVKGRSARLRGDANGARKHPESRRGDRNGRAKLTASDVAEIRTRHARGGVTQRALATRYGVAPTTINHILKRKLWRDDADPNEPPP